MSRLNQIEDGLRGAATRITNSVFSLPELVLMPHSRCNCRCVMCDIWKANQTKSEISTDELKRHLHDFTSLRVRHVTLSGGEALMHSNLWTFCAMLKESGMRISLLSTGILLERNANEIVQYIDDVIVSLDGGEQTHDQIRGIEGSYSRMRDGILALRKISKGYRVTGRSVIQQMNFRELAATLDAGKDLGLDRISFLPVDISSDAFNRPVPWDEVRSGGVALSPEEIDEWEVILASVFRSHHRDFESGWVAESPKKFKWMVSYFRAIHGLSKHKAPPCNAPWVSAVVEANGDIKPCFFHAPYGNLKDGFAHVINSPAARNFRRKLHIRKNRICQSCVCALKRPIVHW